MKLTKTTFCCLLVVTLLFTFSARTWACCGGPVEGELTLKIKGIKTEDDIEKVKSTLIPLEAITDCSVNMERGLLGLVLYPDLITEEVVIGLVRQAGFDATLPGRIDMHLNKSYQEETIRQATANLNSLLGVVVSDVDEESNIIHIDIYKRWVRDIKRVLTPIRATGMDVVVDIETSVFTTDGMTEVDGHDVRAYLLNVFGVKSSDYNPDNDEVEVTFYKDWTTETELLQTIEKRGFTKVTSCVRVTSIY
ncbi:MAG: hypothetical protein ACE5H1_05780 [Thermodesulfobacteriota bacterium]